MEPRPACEVNLSSVVRCGNFAVPVGKNAPDAQEQQTSLRQEIPVSDIPRIMRKLTRTHSSNDKTLDSTLNLWELAES